MSALDRVKITYVREEVERARSLLSLIVAGLKLEDDFQDKHIDCPAIDWSYIPTLGEMIKGRND